MTAELRAALTDHRSYWLQRALDMRAKADTARLWGKKEEADALGLVARNFLDHAYGEPLRSAAALFLERE